MYEFPSALGFLTKKEMKDILKKWNLKETSMTFMKDAKHVFTHIDWLMKGYQIRVKEENSTFLWVSEEELREKYAIPTAFQKFLSE